MANAALKRPRPKYLNLAALLFEIRLPLPGWVSILHRVSGALLFLAVVWLLFLLDRSLNRFDPRHGGVISLLRAA